MDCNITFSARFHYRQGGGVSLHCHSADWQVQLVYGGGGTTAVNDTRFPIKEGDVVLVHRKASHSFLVGPEGMKTLEVKFVTEDKDVVSMLSHIDTLFHDENHQLFDLFTRIVAEGQRKVIAYRTMCDALLMESIAVMMRLSSGNAIVHTENEPNKSPVGQPASLAIQAANEYIYRHMDKNFTLGDLAAGCGYNQDYLYRAIKKEYGVSAIQYVNKLRFDQAKRLMQHTELSLSEIAWNLGFDSIQYFSKFFRQHAHTSPSDYCNKVRSTIRIDY